MQNERTLSIILVAGLLVLSAAVFYWTSDMTPGAELFPRITAAALAVFAAVELIRLLRTGERGAPQPNQPEAGSAPDRAEARRRQSKSAAHMGLFFVMVVVFALIYPVIGFEVAAVLFMAGGMTLLGGRKAARAWLAAVLVPLGLVVIFRFGLDIDLPTLPFVQTN